MALFEYIDSLNTPYDIYYFDTARFTLPISAHWHHYIEILYIMDGTVCVELDQTLYVLKQDDLLIVYPTVIHTIYAADDHFVNYAVIKFNPAEIHLSSDTTLKLRALFSKNEEKRFVHFSSLLLSPHRVRHTVTRLVDEMSRQVIGFNVVIDACLNILLVSLARIWKENHIDLNAAVNNGSCSTIDDILEYIADHTGSAIAVPELAARCNMSYSTFSRLFKQRTGRGCKEYLEYVRICKAQNLLLFTDLSLNYIASETGFTDCSHFIKTYKKYKGITPAQQRKNGLPDGSGRVEFASGSSTPPPKKSD